MADDPPAQAASRGPWIARGSLVALIVAVALGVAWVFPVSMLSTLFVSPVVADLPLVARVLIGVALITIALQLAVAPMRRRLRALRRL